MEGIATVGGTPLVVAESDNGTARVLGVIYLKDVVKTTSDITRGFISATKSPMLAAGRGMQRARLNPSSAMTVHALSRMRSHA